MHYASVHLRHCSSVVFDPRPSLPTHLDVFAVSETLLLCSAPLCWRLGSAASFSQDKNKKLSSVVPVLKSGPWLR